MSDLISRSRLLNEMNDWQYGEAPFLTPDVALEYTAKEMQTMIYRTIKDAMLCVADQPAVDAVPVIRCKDCVHYKGHWYCETWNNSPGFPAVTEDGFCNMAERRTDADE